MLFRSFKEQGKKITSVDYEKALTAFVAKNLLGGQYLPNLINRDQIVGLIKKIAGSGHTGGKVAGQLSQTPGAIKKRQARAAKNAPPATQPEQPAATPTTPQYGKQPSVTYNVPAGGAPAIPPKTTTAPATPGYLTAP